MSATFHLEIVSLDGQEYAGEVQRITLRTITGDIAILARHMNYCTAIGMGTARIIQEDGSERAAACIGGMITMLENQCRVLPTTWEWADEIDVERARRAKARAEERLADHSISNAEKARMEAKLYRALVRLQSAGR